MESWDHINIQILAEPRNKMETLWLEGNDVNNYTNHPATNHAHPRTVTK